MTENAPLVSVGVPAYNAARFLPSTLAALRDQQLQDIEVIVGDNGSTDDTADIARAFAADDERFSYVRNPVNVGMPRNYNVVLSRARAPLFMWNSSDDRPRPEHLVRCVQALADHPESDLAFSRVVYTDADDRVIGEMDDLDLRFEGLSPAERVALFLRRDVYQAIGFGAVARTAFLRGVGGMPVHFSSDVTLGIRMALRTPWIVVPEQTFEARRHPYQSNKLRAADIVDQARFIDPSRRPVVAFPEWYLTYRLYREALTAPVPPAERARAVAAIARWWTAPNWRMLPFDVKRNVVRLVRGRYKGAYFAPGD